MKTQKLATSALSADQLSACFTALATMESHATSLATLTATDKRRARTIGSRSDLFCRRALALMQQHPHLVPTKVPVAQAVADLKAFDEMQPLLARLIPLLARLADTQYALGSNVYAVALEGYSLLRRIGSGDGLKEACAELGTLFSRPTAKTKNRRAGGAGPTPTPDPGPAPTA